MDFQIWYSMWFSVFPIFQSSSHESSICSTCHSQYRIDKGFDNWHVKIYWFRQFCTQFSVLMEVLCDFVVLDDFFKWFFGF